MADNIDVRDGLGVAAKLASKDVGSLVHATKHILVNTDGTTAINPATETTLAALLARAQMSNLATYSISGTGYPAYATPTDLLIIRGSASKIVRVINMRMLVHTTAAALHFFQYLKRSTANTGGTSTSPAGIPWDSGDAAATAVLNLYTAAPTTGTSLGALSSQYLTSTVPTSVPGLAQTAGVSTTIFQVTNFIKPVTLRGVAESFCINYAGAALPAGFAAQWDVTWTESDT